MTLNDYPYSLYYVSKFLDSHFYSGRKNFINKNFMLNILNLTSKAIWLQYWSNRKFILTRQSQNSQRIQIPCGIILFLFKSNLAICANNFSHNRQVSPSRVTQIHQQCKVNLSKIYYVIVASSALTKLILLRDETFCY